MTLPFGQNTMSRARDADAEPRRRQPAESGDSHTNTLATYFREMAEYEVMTPEEEVALARKIEMREQAVWETLLAHPQTVEYVCSLVERAMDNSLREFASLKRSAANARKKRTKAARASLARLAARVGSKLRSLDLDREILQVVLDELDRLDRGNAAQDLPGAAHFKPGSRAFSAYVSLVHASERHAARAREDFVRANLRLVVTVARRFSRGGMPLADLIQEGNLGLMKAVDRFDYTRGYRFSTYASWWIRHAISRALADKARTIRLPVHRLDARQRLNRATEELTRKHGRAPNPRELAKATGLPLKKVKKMLRPVPEFQVSLDRSVGYDDDDRSVLEVFQDPNREELSPLDDMSRSEDIETIRSLLTRLKPIEADILRQRFGLDDDRERTLAEIGRKHDLSRERIRQIQNSALAKLRKALKEAS